jgi:hypothetical protein
MQEQRSVLLVGSSSVAVGDADESLTLAPLVDRALTARVPEMGWTTTAIRIYQGDGMLERIQDAVETHHPDVLFLKVSTYQLTHREVLWSVRDKWPALYPAARFIDRQLTRAAGGASVFANTRRPWVWTLPKKLAVRVFGEAPGTSVEAAISNATRSLDFLLAREDVDVFCWLSADAGRGRTYADPQITADVKSYWTQLQAYMDRRHVPYFTSAQIRRGAPKEHSADGVHGTASETEVRAGFLADRVIEALDLRTAPDLSAEAAVSTA